jgi:predicted metal-dependent phosphoesterase TrpH
MEKFFAMSPADFSVFAQEHGILFYQAHPFRNSMKVVDPKLLFGIEVCNTHPRHDSRNDIASAWAEKYGLHKIGGSDCHQVQDVGTSFIRTDHPVKNENDLILKMRSASTPEEKMKILMELQSTNH